MSRTRRTLARSTLLCVLSTANLSCGDDDDVVGPIGAPSYTLSFEARAGTRPIACGASYPGMGTSTTSIQIRDFRLYISNIRLVGADGTEAPLTLAQDGLWQLEDVALLDFEDGSASCSETGNAPTNTVVQGRAAIERPTGVRFNLGVPFRLNHLDPITRPSPLNVTTMFWSWQDGYKFLKVDLDNGRPAPGNNFNVHLGSRKCPSSASIRPPDGPCERVNLPEIGLDGFDVTTTIVLDLAGLLSGIDTSTNTPMTPPGCMSALSEPEDCSPVFSNLGLSFETGNCVAGCAGQRFVRLE